MSMRIRARMAKQGDARFTSHLDFMRTIGRAARRAGIAVALTRGFHPHQKISLGPALGLGISSTSEFADFELDQSIAEEEFRRRMNESLPSGMRVLDARIIPWHWKPLSAVIDVAKYTAQIVAPEEAYPGLAGFVEKSISSMMSEREFFVTRAKDTIEEKINIRPRIIGLSFSLTDECPSIKMLVTTGNRGSVRPEEVLDAIFTGPFRPLGYSIERTGLFMERQGHLISPMEAGE